MNCQHKFCHHCITTWKVNKMNCPICRSPLLYQGRDFVIDSVVKTWTSFLPEEEQIRRRELVQQRESLMDIAGDLISVPKPLYYSTRLLLQSIRRDYMAIAADFEERVNALSDDDDDDSSALNNDDDGPLALILPSP